MARDIHFSARVKIEQQVVVAGSLTYTCRTMESNSEMFHKEENNGSIYCTGYSSPSEQLP